MDIIPINPDIESHKTTLLNRFYNNSLYLHNADTTLYMDKYRYYIYHFHTWDIRHWHKLV